MYQVSGYQKHTVDRADPNVFATTQVARLHKPDGQWTWETLPPLPKGNGRWLGVAGVAGGYLIVATGSNTSSFSLTGAEDTAGVGPTDGPIPPPLPGFRLKLTPSGSAAPGAKWETIAPFPGGGLDVRFLLARCVVVSRRLSSLRVGCSR